MGNNKSSSSRSKKNQNFEKKQVQSQILDEDFLDYKPVVDILDDDEPIEYNFQKMGVGQNKQKYNLDKGLSLDVKTLHKHFQFNSSASQSIPVMVSVKTLDKTEDSPKTDLEAAKQDRLENRPNLDLVCVIDRSGSMSGNKIENVKKTLEYLLELLGENDRLCLIAFDSCVSRRCHLMKTNSSNKPNLIKIINEIHCHGGTNINSGMELAFRVLKERKYYNPVSSIFLLSDGQDGGADLRVRQSLEKHLSQECFTIHSFGFGSDHDGPLMNKICSLKDGNFYYVEKINQVDEFFVDALGGLFSVIAQEIIIDVELLLHSQYKKFFQNANVSKIYGDMWSVIKQDTQYRVQINQLLSGISKDFIFEITIPANNVERLEDFERNAEIVKATVSAIPVDPTYTTKVVKDNNLVLTLFTQNEKVAQDSEINDSVELNYLRVKASEAMDQAMKEAEQQKYESGQQILQSMIERFDKSHPKNKEKLQLIKKDLEECQQNAKPGVYESEGKFKMLMNMNANLKQQSRAIEKCDMYQNCLQQEMVSKVKAKKGLFQ
ncbi:von willebrand factor type A (vWA) domain was originally protein (macronuclear) [Tetrahymena thermophila SB210]|uniref:von willebrand factor type A (VWA) domain was originally protein n=1 Tax=Tetrahymena thermophila (strain SB210) TaxID=312017 RepID=I7M0N5_TETTS|nr:von willebrand factor type A (vWA) domain was originally protein [Tetrahymena thermophila SB210]EAR89933.1 von willebrand factor type A (vWA) domain was originally protein [Tetrahymena thermophila SB210]|eukprot:XP_001010178.1 von willebrand factor type A (vWA) domain was originally protein [Tetrahymena thermophila SB210]